jgi:hypothetical protein
MNIIVVSYIGSPWLQDCLASLKDVKYPVYVAMNTKEHNRYETAGLDLGNALGEPYVVMQDSMIIKEVGLFDRFAKTPGAVTFAKDYLMYFGKYFRMLSTPEARTKKEAVDVELTWCKDYAKTNRATVLCPDFTDTNIFEDKHGKRRMVLENEYVKKWKNCYRMDMIDGADKVE